MRKPVRVPWGVCILLCCVICLSLSACDEKVRLDPKDVSRKAIRNFHIVTPGYLYRSGFVRPKGFEYLYENGLKTMINLRCSRSDLPWIPDKFKDFYHQIRIPDHHPPTEAQMEEILDVVCDPDSWPVLIHCHEGRGRSGVVIAAIRYTVNGWPMDEAIQEAAKYRKGRMLNDAQLAFLRQWEETHELGERSCYR